MIWPFKKKEPLKITFYTFRPDVYEYHKIQATNKFQPKWLKTIMKNPDWTVLDYRSGLDNVRNMKTCYGFVKQMQMGYTIPLWTDLKIEVNPIGESGYEHLFADNVTRGQKHPPRQRGDFLPETHYDHLKITSPWIGVCSEPIDFWFGPNTWTQPALDSMLLPSGVVDYYYQNATNINIILPRKDHINTIDLMAGDPMIQIIPLTEREIQMECKLVSPQEFERLDKKNYNASFQGSAFKRKKKCPFHRGD